MSSEYHCECNGISSVSRPNPQASRHVYLTHEPMRNDSSPKTKLILSACITASVSLSSILGCFSCSSMRPSVHSTIRIRRLHGARHSRLVVDCRAVSLHGRSRIHDVSLRLHLQSKLVRAHYDVLDDLLLVWVENLGEVFIEGGLFLLEGF